MSSTPSKISSASEASASSLFLSDEEALPRLEMIRKHVAQPIPRDAQNNGWIDGEPAAIEGSHVLVGNKYHAANVAKLVELGVTAVLNCASGGISRLPVDEMKTRGIMYQFTNVRQDNYSYPILFDKDGQPSEHLLVAKSLYGLTRARKGKVLFFCIAGQNRSASLAVAVLLLFGHRLDDIILSLSKTRSFVLENVGFQRQLVELEAMLQTRYAKKLKLDDDGGEMFVYATRPPSQLARRTTSDLERRGMVEVELLIPGLCTMEAKIPMKATIAKIKQCLVDHANQYFLSYSDPPARVAKSWIVLAMFGEDDMYDFPLEKEAIELSVQMELMKTMFGLEVVTEDDSQEQVVHWTPKCRFALVIFSVFKTIKGETYQFPWTFVHEERPGAPATLLENQLMSTYLRAWDFVTGQSYCSLKPIVFSFADPRDRRQFMRISTSANRPVQFHAPGEGGILGLGGNAIVHRVDLGKVVRSTNSKEPHFMDKSPKVGRWDAAVKRHFSLSKMLASLENRSEAGLAKRIRMASLLNSDGRVVEFYGLGVGLSCNAYNEREFKFEAMLLSRYEEEFSAYTMRRFMEDYVQIPERAEPEVREAIIALHAKFSLISVKVLLVSLLNGFRDLTLMGVQAFDFNHLNNVLISKDHKTVRLIDIDGDSKGSIQLDEGDEYIRGTPRPYERIPTVHKPSLDIDLNTVLPTVIQCLILGKGRGRSFVTDKVHEIWHTDPDTARNLIVQVLQENFYAKTTGEDEVAKAEKHMNKVAIWFYNTLKKLPPWGNWTRDIYDAMRCIDHLPIS